MGRISTVTEEQKSGFLKAVDALRASGVLLSDAIEKVRKSSYRFPWATRSNYDYWKQSLEKKRPAAPRAEPPSDRVKLAPAAKSTIAHLLDADMPDAVKLEAIAALVRNT